MKNITLKNTLTFLAVLMVILGAGWGISQAWARGEQSAAPLASPLHPSFAFLDASGENVLTSGQPISTMQTCGTCHDTNFIEQHSFHADLGLSDYAPTAEMNASNGLFGKFDPITYRYLTQNGDERTDLTTPEWLMVYGARVPGGGPATTSRDGQPLTSLKPDASNPETSIVNPATGKTTAWDWSNSGVVEMNCFICHLTNPDNDARVQELQSGNFGWANTATLTGIGLVERTGDIYTYNAEAFDENGQLKREYVLIQDPTNGNCANCHGVVHTDTKSPFVAEPCDTNETQTATTGQLISSQKISESGMNISGKDDLNRSWDIHAERGLQCTDCHYSVNNPVHYQEAAENKPGHLLYDPRRLEIGEYLESPDHNFARGESAQYTVAPELKGTMRRCESCHDSLKTHADWLPYVETHMETVACETCHIPAMYAPAIETYDWTVINAETGSAKTSCRGIDGENTVTDLVTGYTPVLMQRANVDGKTTMAPYNLLTSWYWTYIDTEGNTRPVSQADLKAAYLSGKSYNAEIVAAFDADGDGKVAESELVIDTDSKRDAVAGRLAALGLKNVQIQGQIQPYSINHNVTRGENVVSDCQSCHNTDSRMTQPIQLAANVPAGVMPTFVDSNVSGSGELIENADGSLSYQPMPQNDGIYIFGKTRINWIDWFGALAFVGTLAGVSGHGTLRYLAGLKRKKQAVKTKKVQMYDGYERFWHWLQTVSIMFLLFTGLVIHRPDVFGAFSFRYMVTIHNVLAAILVINAALSLFWHMVSGEIRQYIPHPIGFFDEAIVQAKFYIGGIFKGEPHPFEKTKHSKLNPLQKATYFGLLNVLLPLQIITGALMWGAQTWPEVAKLFGGLPVLAPFHSLVAWMFGAFIVAHVYLTTTGATPLEAMRGMVTGWEELEVHTEEHE